MDAFVLLNLQILVGNFLRPRIHNRILLNLFSKDNKILVWKSEKSIDYSPFRKR